MPSPLAHTATGLALYIIGRSARLQIEPERIGPFPTFLTTTLGFSMLPDIDSVVGLLAGNFGRYHNNLTHSFFAAAVVSTLFAGCMKWLFRARFRDWFGVAFAAYLLHVLMDAAGFGRGVMAFWPFTGERLKAPFPLFYGFHWSDGLISIQHLWTFVTEMVFALLVLGLAQTTALVRARIKR